MNAQDYSLVVQKTLLKMGDKYWSPGAEKILVMIACHESQGFRYRRQVNGPARSYLQIEPDTLTDLYENYLAFRPDKLKLLESFRCAEVEEPLEALEHNDAYAICVARLLLWRKKAPLPAASREDLLSQYAKEHWNTFKGKATANKYLDDYRLYFNSHQKRMRVED